MNDTSPESPMIDIRELTFQYGSRGFGLRIESMNVARGEKLGLIGPSGVGKTTVVSLIAGILRPRAGTLRIDGVDLAHMSDAGRRDFRISRIGFVFQAFELIEYLSVRDNILLPYYINRSLQLNGHARRAAEELAESTGLRKHLPRYPGTLSQGEKQRVAICRAMVTSPALLIADEPTGNLDPTTTEAIMACLLGEVDRSGTTLIMVTHDHDLLASFDRVIDIAELVGGRKA